MKTAVVTGGAGFIGSHLVDELLNRNFQVWVYDDFSSGSRRNLECHHDSPHLELVSGSLLDESTLHQVVQGKDVVFHCAANSDIAKGIADTTLDYQSGLRGTLNLLETLRTSGTNNLVFLSSSAVYGLIDSAASESSGPLLPVSIFGASKVAAEAFIGSYSRLFGLRSLIFRLGNVVGSRMGRGVISDFLSKLSENSSSLKILGDGHQRKSFVHVRDVISGIFHVMNISHLTDDRPCDVYNLATGTSTDVLSIAKFVQMHLHIPSMKIESDSSGKAGDQPHIILDVTKIRNTGWEPSMLSDEAIQLAIRQLDEESTLK